MERTSPNDDRRHGADTKPEKSLLLDMEKTGGKLFHQIVGDDYTKFNIQLPIDMQKTGVEVRTDLGTVQPISFLLYAPPVGGIDSLIFHGRIGKILRRARFNLPLPGAR